MSNRKAGKIVCDLTRGSRNVYFFDEVFDESQAPLYITRKDEWDALTA